MNSIKAKDLKNLINDKSKNIQVIDVRSRTEWDEGHIQDPRVINIEINTLILNTSDISRDKETFVICESGGRSSLAQVVLKAKGFKTTNVLDGMSGFRKLN
jgi:rhodanese-related sulfurtransferase